MRDDQDSAQIGAQTFAQILRDLLNGVNGSHWTVQALADALSIDRTVVSRWLSGARLPALRSGYLEQLATVLNLSPSDQVRLQAAYYASLRDRKAQARMPARQERHLLASLGRPGMTDPSIFNDKQLPSDLIGLPLPAIPTTIRGEEEVMRLAIRMTATTPRITPHTRTIYFTFNGARNILPDRHGLDVWWKQAIRGALQRGWDIVQLIRLDENLRRSIEIVDSIRAYLGMIGTYQPYYFTQYGTLAVPDGLCIVPGNGALVMFATTQAEHVDAALYVPDTDDYIDLLRAHVERFRLSPGVVEPLLRVFQYESGDTSNRNLLFAQALAEYEQKPGPMFVAKDFPSNSLRPASCFEDSATYLSTYPRERRHEFQALLRERQQNIPSRLQSDALRVLCSKQALLDFARDGWSQSDRIPVEESLSPPIYRPEERWDQIVYLIDLLERFPTYEVALLDEQETKQFLDITWEAIGDSAVMVESWVPDEHGNEVQVDLEITEPTIVRSFQAYGDTLWSRVAPHNRERTWVIWWLTQRLEELKHRFPELERERNAIKE